MHMAFDTEIVKKNLKKKKINTSFEIMDSIPTLFYACWWDSLAKEDLFYYNKIVKFHLPMSKNILGKSKNISNMKVFGELQ